MSDDIDFWMNDDDPKVTEDSSSDSDGDSTPVISQKGTPKKIIPKMDKVLAELHPELVVPVAPDHIVTRREAAASGTDSDLIRYNYQSMREIDYPPPRKSETYAINMNDNPIKDINPELANLKRDLLQLEDMAKEDVHVPYEIPTDSSDSDEDNSAIRGYKKVTFIDEATNRTFKKPYKPDESFRDVFDKLPHEYQFYTVEIDGFPWPPDQVSQPLVRDHEVIKLIPPKPTSANDEGGNDSGKKRLSVMMPTGDKKRVAVDPNTTFAELLEKLGNPGRFLEFDGERLNLKQKIGDNDEIEDGDQIDVVT